MRWGGGRAARRDTWSSCRYPRSACLASSSCWYPRNLESRLFIMNRESENLPPAPVPVPPLLLPAVPQWQLLPPNAAVGRFHWHAGPGDITTWLASDVFTQPGMPNSTVISLLPLTFPTDGNSLSSPEVWLARDTKIPQNAGSRRDGGPRWGLDSLAF